MPLSLEVSPAEAAVLEDRAEVLGEMGLGVEPFGGQTVLVYKEQPGIRLEAEVGLVQLTHVAASVEDRRKLLLGPSDREGRLPKRPEAWALGMEGLPGRARPGQETLDCLPDPMAPLGLRC